ncbi:hypothetical protein HPB50_008477 [Hyalomma asiaticum]|uniref:Uncharacterized protein n=1 Tax=Hyalomma asiaticum TaxID=266040 RepID=A0ACB7RV28_HYAAI|nr:hypothetical protein HPB50_008477 [Hyalomma asiaticum]
MAATRSACADLALERLATTVCHPEASENASGGKDSPSTSQSITAQFQAATDFEQRCNQGPETGLCRAFIPMWWFNAKTGECEEFIYGGCRGNDNRYETKEECEETCSTKKLSYKNAETSATPDEVKKESELEGGFHCCVPLMNLPHSEKRKRIRKINFKGIPASVAEVCMRPAYPGPCLAYFPRFYYDPKTYSCRPFIYGGCKSNGNNFETLRACREFCA